VTELAEVINAIASLAWPLLVLFLLLRFSGAIRTVVESAARRKFSLKIGGNELTMDEFSEQQIKVLADLQAELNKVQTKVLAANQTVSLTTGAESRVIEQDSIDLPERGTHKVLWVDDNPRNNSYIIAVVEERGSRVDIALSTDEAMRKYVPGKYDAVISDMGRPESGRAGLDLADRIRALDSEIPLLIFSGDWAARNMKDEALAHGVNHITASSSRLLAELGRIGII
jgi:CheY-like chemotaxis protein